MFYISKPFAIRLRLCNQPTECTYLSVEAIAELHLFQQLLLLIAESSVLLLVGALFF